jgi:hypothetical protein
VYIRAEYLGSPKTLVQSQRNDGIQLAADGIDPRTAVWRSAIFDTAQPTFGFVWRELRPSLVERRSESAKLRPRIWVRWRLS